MPKPFCITDPDKLKQDVQAYFDHCHSTEKIYDLKSGDIKIRKQFPTMTGLANWLGISRDSLYRYTNGEENTAGYDAKCIKAISDTLIHAKQDIAEELMQAAISGDADSRIAGMLLTAMGETTPENSTTVNVIIQGDCDAYSV